jgi:hypothetical protein
MVTNIVTREFYILDVHVVKNFKFPFHLGIFSITFHFKCVLNILLF